MGNNVFQLREKQLVFDFIDALDAKTFDNSSHGLSHCMKAVDFIVEYSNFDLFVEVKDPDHTRATSKNHTLFEEDFKSGKLVNDLVGKYRDSWLYRWAEGRDKPVRYVVLLQLSTLGPPELGVFADHLKRRLPMNAPKVPSWTRHFLAGAAVLDIRQWNEFGHYGTVRRVPDT